MRAAVLRRGGIAGRLRRQPEQVEHVVDQFGTDSARGRTMQDGMGGQEFLCAIDDLVGDEAQRPAVDKRLAGLIRRTDRRDKMLGAVIVIRGKPAKRHAQVIALDQRDIVAIPSRLRVLASASWKDRSNSSTIS
ncbi:MAG: hypothetical protein R8G60_02585 [Roseovarius pacificus]|nr:hypothetical protein [Roseovarius pacificus]